MVHKVLRLDTAKTYVLENKNDWMDPRIEYRKSIHSQRNIYCLCSILQLFSKILCISCLKTTIYIYNKPNVCILKFFVSLSLTLLFLPENMQSAWCDNCRVPVSLTPCLWQYLTRETRLTTQWPGSQTTTHWQLLLSCYCCCTCGPVLWWTTAATTYCCSCYNINISIILSLTSAPSYKDTWW